MSEPSSNPLAAGAAPSGAAAAPGAVDPAAVALTAPAAAALARVPLMNGLVSTAVVVAALYFGRDLLMPLALAILVGFVLDPLVSWLKRRGVPRTPAVALVVAATVALLAATGFLIFAQLRQIANDLPVYETNIARKLHSFGRALRQPGILDQYSRVVTRMEREFDLGDRPAAGAAPAKPAAVEVVAPQAKPWQRIAGWLETFATPAAMAGIVFVFVVLILLDKGDLRDRALRLLGGDLYRSTDALGDAAQRVSKYLAMQVVVNATYGIPAAVGLLLIGVPGALAWGMLAAVLRFVPYVGPVIASIFPITLAFAVDPGWNMVLWTVALIATIELISNNLVEPWLYGSTTGLSTMSLILAALFWTALWGPIGLVLSTPITVVLLALGHHIPNLQFLEVLLGSERALDEPRRLYQRLLAGDVEEAVELGLQYAEDDSLRAFYDDVALGALRLSVAERDTVAAAERRHRVSLGMGRVVEELREQYAPPPGPLPVRVLCVGARWTVDAASADMAAHVIEQEGIGARALPNALTLEAFKELDLEGIELVCLAFFAPEPQTPARYAVRRFKRRWPNVQLVLALWNDVPAPGAGESFDTLGADAIVTDIGELLAQVQARLARADGTPYTPAPIPADEADRLDALRESGALNPALRGTLDGLAQRVADAFDCRDVEIVLVDAERQWTHGDARAAGRAAEGEPEAGGPREQSLAAHVVARDAELVLPDVLRDPRFSSNPLLEGADVRFFAGVPLHGPRDRPIGALCLFDDEPRTLSTRDLMLLQSMADDIMAEVRAQNAGGAAPPGEDEMPAAQA